MGPSECRPINVQENGVDTVRWTAAARAASNTLGLGIGVEGDADALA